MIKKKIFFQFKFENEKLFFNIKLSNIQPKNLVLNYNHFVNIK